MRARLSMNGPDPDLASERAREAVRWLQIAIEDRRVAETCIRLSPPAVNSAAYHCQQAAEKLIKGMLVVAGIHFPKTHDLLTLSKLAETCYPADVGMLAETVSLTEWAYAYRYPGMEDGPPPHEAEIAGALDLIERLSARLA